MMKRCTECYEVYEADQNFCEVDGQALLDDPTLSLTKDERLEPVAAGPRTAWFTGIVGLMAGILICVCFYVGYSLLTIDNESGRPESNVTDRLESDSGQRDRRPARTDSASVADVTEETSEDSETSEADDPVVQEPPATGDKVAARLNRGPVSTSARGQDESEDSTVRTVIEMNDGTEAEVDAAWEDSRGVWYRRGGLVSFVESNRVKAITARAEPKSSP